MVSFSSTSVTTISSVFSSSVESSSTVLSGSGVGSFSLVSSSTLSSATASESEVGSSRLMFSGASPELLSEDANDSEGSSSGLVSIGSTNGVSRDSWSVSLISFVFGQFSSLVGPLESSLSLKQIIKFVKVVI